MFEALRWRKRLGSKMQWVWVSWVSWEGKIEGKKKGKYSGGRESNGEVV